MHLEVWLLHTMCAALSPCLLELSLHLAVYSENKETEPVRGSAASLGTGGWIRTLLCHLSLGLVQEKAEQVREPGLCQASAGCSGSQRRGAGLRQMLARRDSEPVTQRGHRKRSSPAPTPPPVLLIWRQLVGLSGNHAVPLGSPFLAGFGLGWPCLQACG